MVSVSRPPVIDWPGLSTSPGSRRSLLAVALAAAVLAAAVLAVAAWA